SPIVDANGMPMSMCVAWFSPSDSLSRFTAHDASFDTTELMPNFLKNPSSCAMTIGAQSVSAIMPKRMFGVSGESSAYTLPVQPAGSPFISVAALLAATALLRKRRRDVLFIGSPSELQIQFEETKVDGIAAGVDRLRHESTGRVAEVAADADMRRERDVAADVLQRAE